MLKNLKLQNYRQITTIQLTSYLNLDQLIGIL